MDIWCANENNILDNPPLYISYRVPKCEIFNRSDIHDFYTIKPFCVGDFGAKYKFVNLTFGGARHYLISFAHDEHAHQFLTHTISVDISSWHARSLHASNHYAHDQHVLKVLFKFWIFMLMLSIHIRNWCVCSGHTHCMHQFLTSMISMFWRSFSNLEF